jgi:hypothetical protein
MALIFIICTCPFECSQSRLAAGHYEPIAYTPDNTMGKNFHAHVCETQRHFHNHMQPYNIVHIIVSEGLAQYRKRTVPRISKH